MSNWTKEEGSAKKVLIIDIIQLLSDTYCTNCAYRNSDNKCTECDLCPVQNAMIGASNGI